VNVLFELWAHANWLSGALANAVVARFENPARVAVTWDFDAPMPEVPFEEVRNVVRAYTGQSAEQEASEFELGSHSREVAELAEARADARKAATHQPKMSRADRRAETSRLRRQKRDSRDE